MEEKKHHHEHEEHCGCHKHEHEEHCVCHKHEHEEHCGCHEHEHEEHCGCHEHKHEHEEHCGCHEHHHDHGCSCGHDHGEDGCGCGHDHGKEGGTKDWLIPVIGLAAMIAVILIPFADSLKWLQIALYAVIYLFVGHEVLLESAKHIAKGKIFDENFLMAVASIGAFVIGDYPEAIAVMIFYNVGEFCQNAAIRRSRKSVSDLMDIRPDYANLLSDGVEKRVAPQQVQPGDIIILRPGEKIPLDCTIIEGSTAVNTAALTGESVPADCGVGDMLMSGCINVTGVVKARVEKSFAQSTVSKVLALMEESSAKKTKPERFISRFAKVYTPIVCGIALLTAVIPPLFNGEWTHWIHTALTFLVISCPCALVISVPLSYVGGIGNASRYGILFKGSAAMEQLPKLSDLVCDKTGTVTEGRFTVKSIFAPGGDASEVLSIAAAAEQNTTHPIGRSIVERAQEEQIFIPEAESCKEIAGKGIEAVIGGKTVLAGSVRLLQENGVAIEKEMLEQTTVYLAEDGKYLGCITLADEIRPQAKPAFGKLQAAGICCTMLTGDRKDTAQKVASDLGLSGYRAELLPQDKVQAVEEILQKAKGSVAFVGDGVNDAPVLARADVGIAMGEIGSDAALEAADVVIMKDDLSRLPLAVRLSKQTRAIVYQNIIFALGIKLFIMVLGFAGYANMWLAVFADVGVALLAILNAVRPILTKKKV